MSMPNCEYANENLIPELGEKFLCDRCGRGVYLPFKKGTFGCECGGRMGRYHHRVNDDLTLAEDWLIDMLFPKAKVKRERYRNRRLRRELSV